MIIDVIGAWETQEVKSVIMAVAMVVPPLTFSLSLSQ